MKNDTNPPAPTVVAKDPAEVNAALETIAGLIVAANPDITSVALLGVVKRGKPMAERLATLIHEKTGHTPPVGSVSTLMYRDDLRSGKGPLKADSGETHFDFDVDGLNVVLVDDVIAAGRTARAAMEAVIDYGRPARIQLACLVDRPVRELPIQPDFLGWTLATKAGERVLVRFTETDEEDAVLIEQGQGA